MKQYGFNFATEFSKKQIGVVYAAAKRGDLKVEKWYMSRLYDLADYYGHDDNRSVEFEERFILNILDAVFSGDYETAQKMIEKEEEDHYNLMGRKTQNSIDRTVMVK